MVTGWAAGGVRFLFTDGRRPFERDRCVMQPQAEDHSRVYMDTARLQLAFHTSVGGCFQEGMEANYLKLLVLISS